ncbi:MAG: hypothetical protein EAZ15_02630 [Sphingobacteriales bacterium]|nr:MAG: hypothetical protein EAZ15_02630 [Sphingobacteriales bacterium]
MKFTKILFAVAIVATTLPTFAQNYDVDAFRFSGATNSATARFNALGGAQTSLGGDLTSLYGNPAGLGMFTKSEFSFTPSFNTNNNETSFLDTKTTQNTNHVNLNNMGIVFHSPIAKTGDLTSGVLSFNFGIGYQKTNFFKNDINFRGGVTNSNGISDYLSERANGEGVKADFIASNVTFAGFFASLIDTLTTNGRIYKPLTASDADQNLRLNTKGNQSNVDFSMGLNIGNKLYLGATLGLASINYRSNNILNEQGLTIVKDNSGVNQVYDYNANFVSNYDTQGSGVNFKIGAILKPVYEFRIGLSLETPTWYSITDNYSENLSLRDIKNKPVNEKDSYPFDYRLSTPLKLNGGISYFISNKGFLTANVNFVDYSGIRFRSNNSTTDATTNAALSSRYKEALNYSFGAEFKLIDNFMIRGGYSSFGNPYQNIDFKSENYSGGLGYRFGSYYIDGAVIFNQNNIQNQYFSYSLNNRTEPAANRITQTTNVSLTFGARF